ncbi:MAG: family 43 glycosylhydrolase [Gaiellaceae bacterium]
MAGSVFRITDVTRNVGRIKARRTQVIYIAVRGRKLRPGARVVARRWVPALRPGRASRGTVKARLPARARTGRYRLMTCAGLTRVPAAYDRSRCRIVRGFRLVPPSPANEARPAVKGTPTDGQTLTAATGAWRGLAPISYRTSWQRCDNSGAGCTQIPAVAGASYTLTPADVGAAIRVAVTAQNAFGTRTVASRPTSRVTALPPGNTSPPVVSGTAVSGSSVHADVGRWSGTPPISYAYQWQQCDDSGDSCRDLDAATAPDYPVPYSDVGPTLRVGVTASGPGGSSTAVSPAVPEGLWMNPVYTAGPVPDPFVLDLGDKHADYWAFHTGDRFPVLHSTDLINWTAVGPAMTARPSWVVQSGDWHPWAPSVIQTTSPCPGSTTAGCFVMYYVGLSAQYRINCVAVATASKPAGPYTDQGPLDTAAPSGTPVGCADDAGAGNIDPSPFVDTDGHGYLYVSTDFAKSGGTQTLQPTISVIPLSPTLMAASGSRVPLFSGSPGTWEAAGVSAPTVEGPTMVKHGALYYVLYSGGSWRGAYGMGYATSNSPTGPFTKAGNQILSETTDVDGPGGGDTPVVAPAGGTWLAYHGRSSSRQAPRVLRIDRFGWSAGNGGPDVPVIAGPTSTPQPAQP